MELGKRHIKKTYTPKSLKKMKYDPSIIYTRVYYSSSFDLYNFSDEIFLKFINEHFHNCFLIVGIENTKDKCIMSLKEREEALKQCIYVRMILCPAPKLDYGFFESLHIDYICGTPDSYEKYAEVNLFDKLVILKPPVELSSTDLVARIVSNRDEFLYRCLSRGYSRTEIGIPLYKQLFVKILDFKKSHTWNPLDFTFFKILKKRTRKIAKKIGKKFEYIENIIKEVLIGNLDD